MFVFFVLFCFSIGGNLCQGNGNLSWQCSLSKWKFFFSSWQENWTVWSEVSFRHRFLVFIAKSCLNWYSVNVGQFCFSHCYNVCSLYTLNLSLNWKTLQTSNALFSPNSYSTSHIFQEHYCWVQRNINRPTPFLLIRRTHFYWFLFQITVA